MTTKSLFAADFTLTALAAVMTMTMAGCGGGAVASKPDASMQAGMARASGPANHLTKRIDPLAQPAVDAYLAYVSASTMILRKPLALDQGLGSGAEYTRYSFDPEASEFTAFIHEMSSQGLRMVGDPGQPRPQVLSMDLAATPSPVIFLSDCPTPAAGWAPHDIKTGMDVSLRQAPGTVQPTYRTKVKMISSLGHWGVSEITADTSQTCTH